MASKKKKVLQHLHKCIEHDFGFYNPEWKWSSLPNNISENFKLIEETLIDWQKKGYIELYKKDDIQYIKIIKVPEKSY